MVYTKDETLVDREDLEKVSRKASILINRPFQVGIAVYQLAKLRSLELYYDFLNYFVESEDFELIQMDTDSKYLAISVSSIEEVIRPERCEQFQGGKSWSTRGRGR